MGLIQRGTVASASVEERDTTISVFGVTLYLRQLVATAVQRAAARTQLVSPIMLKTCPNFSEEPDEDPFDQSTENCSQSSYSDSSDELEMDSLSCFLVCP